MRNQLFNWHGCLLGVLLVFMTFFVAACDDDDDAAEYAPFDASKEVVVSDFLPKSGGVYQRLVIKGENFGNDKDIVSVTIGGQPAVIVNVIPNTIYCFVPEKAFSGEIVVTVGNSSTGIKQAEAKERFQYERKMVLSTVMGIRNAFGDDGWRPSSISEGAVPFERAIGFSCDGFLKFDPLYPDRMYIAYDGGDNPGIQLVDFTNKTVQVILSNNWGTSRVRSVDFTLDGQYMIVAVDNAAQGNTTPSVFMLKRNYDGSFTNASTRVMLAAYMQCNGASIHPINGELYFNSYENGQVFRLDIQKYFDLQEARSQWDPQSGEPEPAEWTGYRNDGAFEELFRIQDPQYEFQIDIHPSGKYAYIVVINRSYILRTDYDEVNHTFMTPYVVAGKNYDHNSVQDKWRDGVGTDANLARPYQGVFVKNPDYAGNEDEYDFYFCDNQNHCVRYLTPDGVVRTYCGRGSASILDNNYWGTEDGDLREVARFRDPTGITYDENTNTFYILDTVGNKIRKISMETEDE